MRALTKISRRNLLKASSLAIGGGLLTRILKARAEAAESGGNVADTAAIFVTLGGGPSQFETYDPKPEAPLEYRGPFQAIRTKIPGQQFCELLPRQAAILDQLAIIRSVHHEQASHIAEHIVETGYDLRNSANSRTGEMPSMGSIVSKIRGGNASGIPAYVSMPKHHAYAGAHWLGNQHSMFGVNDDPNEADFQVGNLALNPKLDLARVNDRRGLLKDLDRAQRLFDLAGNATAIDAISAQAFDLIAGDRAREAFDIGQEKPETRERYGRNVTGQRMLMARRLVEAGVPFVTVRMGAWDDHEDLPKKIAERAPIFDTGVASLIEDLRERGLTQKVLVVAMGEFGRTPRVNVKAGRDHWPAVNSIMLAGGKFTMGQVIGETDAHGAHVTAAPYRPQNVLGMIYRHLGIDPALAFNDYSGRPRYVLEEREVVSELL